jgi:beta-glucanase (GH16 family)
MKTFSWLLPLLAATSSNALTTPRDIGLDKRFSSKKPGYTTTFFDDFGGPVGSLPSSANWIIDRGTSYPGGAPHWGNNELETYTDHESNLHVSQRHTLVLTPQLSKGAWTSARIETRRTNFAAASGGKLYVEAGIKLGTAPTSQQKGIWPAFWALGAEFRGNYTNWPICSEWDIMENLDGQSTIYNTLHCGTAPGGPCNEYDGIGNGGVSISRSGFHIYGFQVDRSMVGKGKTGTWKQETLTWFLDGKSVLKITGAHIGDENTWTQIAHQGHFLLLNVAVGGNWPGYPNAQTAYGEAVQMEVEYVGVWNS